MNRPTRMALAVAALLAASAQAQQAANDVAKEQQEADLPTVNVTAKGYAADSAETPIATTELGREALERKGAQNLGEALRGEAIRFDFPHSVDVFNFRRLTVHEAGIHQSLDNAFVAVI